MMIIVALCSSPEIATLYMHTGLKMTVYFGPDSDSSSPFNR